MVDYLCLEFVVESFKFITEYNSELLENIFLPTIDSSF